MNSRSQSFFVYFLLIVAIGAMFYMGLRENLNTEKPLTINEVALAVQKGEVARIAIDSDDTIRVIFKNGVEEGVESRKEPDATFVDQLRSLGVTTEQLAPENVVIEVSAPSVWAGVLSGAIYILPVILMAGVLWFIFR